MPNYNSPRYQRLYSQIQTSGYSTINNTTGIWNNAGAQFMRLDAGSFTGRRNAPYSRFPILTGNRSEVVGIRGRKNVNAWSIRGMPLIPSGSAGVIPDMAMFWQNIFGVAGTISAGVSVTYGPFVDSGNFPLSLMYFNHNSTAFTEYAYWGAFVERWQINFNTNFLTVDLDGFAGWGMTNTGFSVTDTLGKAGLTAFPVEPGSPATAGQPIAGFGNGYTCTLHSDSLELKTTALSIGGETGWTQIANVLGSPYPIAAVGDSRRMYIQLSSVDDDSSALNDIKTQCETDNVSITATVVAGTNAGSIVTSTLNNVQPEIFDITDNGPIVIFDLPNSYAHETSLSSLDDFTLVLT